MAVTAGGESVNRSPSFVLAHSLSLSLYLIFLTFSFLTPSFLSFNYSRSGKMSRTKPVGGFEDHLELGDGLCDAFRRSFKETGA